MTSLELLQGNRLVRFGIVDQMTSLELLQGNRLVRLGIVDQMTIDWLGWV